MRTKLKLFEFDTKTKKLIESTSVCHDSITDIDVKHYGDKLELIKIVISLTNGARMVCSFMLEGDFQLDYNGRYADYNINVLIRFGGYKFIEAFASSPVDLVGYADIINMYISQVIHSERFYNFVSADDRCELRSELKESCWVGHR